MVAYSGFAIGHHTLIFWAPSILLDQRPADWFYFSNKNKISMVLKCIQIDEVGV
jgi:hypothetical protein